MASLDRLTGPVEKIAPRLLGSVVRHGAVAIRLTEVEAYGGVGQDEASHSHRGRTRRNEVMFGQAGRLYVYFTYGMHWCANVVTGEDGQASAVLLRAGEVIDGLELVMQRRGSGVPPRMLASGPARLASALGIDGSSNGVDLLDPESPIRLMIRRPVRDFVAGPRVGVSKEAERPWRFWLPGEPTVSAYRRRKLRAAT